MKKSLVLATAFCAVAATANATTLLTNGDFEAGNTGFTSALGYTPATTGGAATYDVDTNPNDWFGLFADFGDNTSGTGNMMMVNGATTAGVVVWSQTVAVSASTDYSFDGFMAAIFPGASALTLAINSSEIGTITGPATTGTWQAFGLGWNSGAATSATISLLQSTVAFSANDYALDDLSFTAAATSTPVIPLPAAGWMLLAGLGGLFGLRRTKRSS